MSVSVSECPGVKLLDPVVTECSVTRSERRDANGSICELLLAGRDKDMVVQAGSKQEQT
ncbi:hypothetical protein M9458_010494, partial [Cirrhinus mrigala]